MPAKGDKDLMILSSVPVDIVRLSLEIVLTNSLKINTQTARCLSTMSTTLGPAGGLHLRDSQDREENEINLLTFLSFPKKGNDRLMFKDDNIKFQQQQKM